MASIHPKKILYPVLLLLYAYFCFLMYQITLQYIPINFDVAFLRIKQDYVDRSYYRWAFFLHTYFAILALPAGFTQFSHYIKIKHLWIHRFFGWSYIIAILFVAAPTGFIIGLHANGGFSSQLGFCSLAVLWFIFTTLALLKILKKDIVAHQKFMIRSFALTLSAITLRAWKYILVALFHPRPMDMYRLVAWLGWVGNLIVAEIIIYYLLRKKNV